MTSAVNELCPVATKKRRFAVGGDSQAKHRPILPKIPEVYEVLVNETGVVRRYLLPIKDIPPFRQDTETEENNSNCNKLTPSVQSAANQSNASPKADVEIEQFGGKPQPVFKIGFLKKQDVRDNVLVTSHVIRVSETNHSQKVLTHHTSPDTKLSDIISKHRLLPTKHDRQGAELSDVEREALIRKLMEATTGSGYNQYAADSHAQLTLMNQVSDNSPRNTKRTTEPSGLKPVSTKSSKLRTQAGDTESSQNQLQPSPSAQHNPSLNNNNSSTINGRVVGTLKLMQCDGSSDVRNNMGNMQPSKNSSKRPGDSFRLIISEPDKVEKTPVNQPAHSVSRSRINTANIHNDFIESDPSSPLTEFGVPVSFHTIPDAGRSDQITSDVIQQPDINNNSLVQLEDPKNVLTDSANKDELPPYEREQRIRRLKEDIQKHLQVADSLRRDSLIERMMPK